MNDLGITVSKVAREADVPPHVVRYYTRIGLLKPRRHPENGYKLFDRRDAQRLRFIRQAQALGFTLEEIAQILEEANEGRSPCPQVRTILRRHIADNRRKLAELAQLQARMEQALAHWERMPDGAPNGDSVCHLIESEVLSDPFEST